MYGAGDIMTLTSGLPAVGVRARRRVAYRLLPFVFLLYVVNYIDRVNVSFANLRMSTDLGFSDRVYGLGVGMFYLTYVLFEIPGAIIVERWSARKCWRVLCRPLLLGSCRSQLLSRNDCLPDTLVFLA